MHPLPRRRTPRLAAGALVALVTVSCTDAPTEPGVTTDARAVDAPPAALVAVRPPPFVECSPPQPQPGGARESDAIRADLPRAR